MGSTLCPTTVFPPSTEYYDKVLSYGRRRSVILEAVKHDEFWVKIWERLLESDGDYIAATKHAEESYIYGACSLFLCLLELGRTDDAEKAAKKALLDK